MIKIYNLLDFKDDDLKQLSCRLVLEEGMYLSVVNSVANKAAIFEESVFVVASNVTFDSDITFRIQILKGDNKKGGVSKFIAIVEVSVVQLLECEGLNIELLFYPDGQEEPGVLVIRSICTIQDNASQTAEMTK